MSEEKNDTKLREHLANERTFLAWIRTSIALMGLGFVIVKFGLFLKEVAIMLKDFNVTISEGFSSVVGTAMVALGVILAFFAYFQYKKVETQINRQSYKSSSLISILLTLVIVVGGFFLVVHLLTGIII
ncbi:MAG: YidH family protein [Mariniphaga sp.]